MVTNRFAAVVMTATVCSVLTSAARGQVVFYENFDDENSGVPMLDYLDFTQFTVADGSVDLLGPGLFDFIPGSGLYLDMDGTQFNAGTLVSESITLPAGDYRLSFGLSFNVNPMPATNTMEVVVGGMGVASLSGIDGLNHAEFRLQQFEFTIPSATEGTLIFIHGGGDNGGYLLDEIELRRIECLPDTNGDGVLSPADFSAWVAAFNTQAPECDQNGDGVCSPADFSAWVANFNTGC